MLESRRIDTAGVGAISHHCIDTGINIDTDIEFGKPCSRPNSLNHCAHNLPPSSYIFLVREPLRVAFYCRPTHVPAQIAQGRQCGYRGPKAGKVKPAVSAACIPCHAIPAMTLPSSFSFPFLPTKHSFLPIYSPAPCSGPCPHRGFGFGFREHEPSSRCVVSALERKGVLTP